MLFRSEGDEGQEGSYGTAYQIVYEHLVGRAFQGTSSKRSPGPDGIGPLAIRYIYEREPERVIALVRTHIRLGIHPDK